MKIKAIILAKYPIQRGTYMGETYQNMSVVIASTEHRTDTNLRDRLAIKFKGKHLDQFLAADPPLNHPYTFDLILDAEERKQNGETYPANKAITCVGFESIPNS